jgi:hypothetical protein
MAEHSVPAEQQALEAVSLILHEIVDALLGLLMSGTAIAGREGALPHRTASRVCQVCVQRSEAVLRQCSTVTAGTQIARPSHHSLRRVFRARVSACASVSGPRRFRALPSPAQSSRRRLASAGTALVGLRLRLLQERARGRASFTELDA